jgi:hypothetical protein
MVGVSRPTGDAWAKQAKLGRAEQEARRGLIATKTEFAAKLTEIALHKADVAPRDQVNAIAQASKMLGFDAPTQTHNVNVQVTVAPDMLSLIRARRAARIAERERQALASGEQRAIGPGGSPIQSASGSVLTGSDASPKILVSDEDIVK